ncbi:pentapeptide repeat-containing protein [Candidatus Bandiella euplotis]|uniref:pentapeptide repeat-containing protein n=1 Tax=Candidatus Bandiella euplotis TaxID=1664265 RepID=UPI002B25C922|nr:hypothetical protein [Candidatus Bandiella woodruffii]
MIDTLLNNAKFKRFLTSNSTAIGDFTQFLTERIPMLRDLKHKYLGEVKVNELVKNLIIDVLISEEAVKALTKTLYNGGILNWTEAILKSNQFVLPILTTFPVWQYLSKPKLEIGADVENAIRANGVEDTNILLSDILSHYEDFYWLNSLENATQLRSFNGITLDNAKLGNGFDGITIDGFSFTDAYFINLNFNNSKIELSSFIRAKFDKSLSVNNANLSNVSFDSAQFPNQISFRNSVLTNVNFENISLFFNPGEHVSSGKIDFTDATLDGVTLDSLAKAVKKNPELKDALVLKDARIVGNLSTDALTTLDLVVKGANFDGIGGMQKVEKLQLINHIAEEIGSGVAKKIFGNNMSESRKKDMYKIIQLLKDEILPEIAKEHSMSHVDDNLIARWECCHKIDKMLK